MDFFKKRSVAVILAIIIVLCSTLISINVKLEAKCNEVSDIFYDGVKLNGVEYPSMATPVKELCSIGDNIITIANNYGIDTSDLSDELRYLRLAMQYSSDDVGYIGSCYSDYIKELKAIDAKLNDIDLSDRHTVTMAEYQLRIEECTETISQGASGYNEAVRVFLKSYDKYPTDFWAEMTNTYFPTYFGNY